MNKKIITQIENIRKKNNTNWMNMLRIAFKYAPKETSAVMKKINICDQRVSKLVSKLSSSK